MEIPVQALGSTKSEWEGMRALHIALLKGHNKIVQMLLEAGESPVELVPDEGQRLASQTGPLAIARDPLGIASASSDIDLETLKQLYEATMAHPKKPNNIEVDALCSAVLGWQPDKVQALLELGAEDRPLGRTLKDVPIAIRAAIDTEQSNVVEILLRQKHLYQPRNIVLLEVKTEAEDHLATLRRGLKNRTWTKNIISMLERDIEENERSWARPSKHNVYHS